MEMMNLSISKTMWPLLPLRKIQKVKHLKDRLNAKEEAKEHLLSNIVIYARLEPLKPSEKVSVFQNYGNQEEN